MVDQQFTFSPNADAKEAGEASSVSQQDAQTPKGEAQAATVEASAPDLSKGQPVQGIYFIPDPEAGRRKKWRKRHPKLFWLIILVLLFVLFNVGAAIYMALDEEGYFSGPRLGIARLEGMILDSAEMVGWLDYLQHNDSVKGVLLYVNSGGGAVVPSQEIFSAVKRLAKVKPVVTYMSTAGASGGYYVAVGSHYIVASPSTLTGSIGVRMDMVNMQKLFDTVGIKQQSLASGALKGAGTPFRPMRPDEEAYLRSVVNDMYEVFIADVAAGRKLKLEEVRALADGRAYTGRQAKELGLIDSLGDLKTALGVLNQRCGLTEPAQDYLDGPPDNESFLGKLLGKAVNDLVKGLRVEQSNGPAFYY